MSASDKAPDAFRTIAEVAEIIGVKQHVLRYWESQFDQVKPVKRSGNRRHYRRSDIELIAGLRLLLHEESLTIKGAQRILSQKGTRHVASLGAEYLAKQRPAIEDIETDETPGPLPEMPGKKANTGIRVSSPIAETPATVESLALETGSQKPDKAMISVAIAGRTVAIQADLVNSLKPEERNQLEKLVERLSAVKTRAEADIQAARSKLGLA